MIALRDVSIRSGPMVLKGVQLSVSTGQYAVLMGATGQGKTTILEAVCGLRSVIAGQVLIGHVDMTRWKPANRGVGYVPQDLALFPTMSVREHLEFALRLRRQSAAYIQQRVAELAYVLDIEPLLTRGVRHLSGGEAQRVALGRAIAFDPQVLLLDEPLAALDEATRHRLCDVLRSIQRSRGLTTLHITHNRQEARWLADRLFVIENRQVTERSLTELTPPDATESAASPMITANEERSPS